jgi:rRNA maturation RNase YbeY
MISFHFEDLKPKTIGSKTELRDWINKTVEQYEMDISDVNIIFCSDAYLLEKNIQFLNHDYYTDIITFNYNEVNTLSGDLFISYDRVKENAQKLDVKLIQELRRVIIHGILHLCGLNDKTETEEKAMRAGENLALEFWNVSRGT